MSRSVQPTTCHPGRQHFGKGLCGTCYMRLYREGDGRTRSGCHPDLPLYARGLCHNCYRQRFPARRGPATCHPKRPTSARGLCGSCYGKAYREGEFERRPYFKAAAETRESITRDILEGLGK